MIVTWTNYGGLLRLFIEVSGLFIDLYHERVESTRKIVCDRDFESCKNDFEGIQASAG